MSKHITGHTGLLCLLGSPVAHSVSPEMHNEAQKYEDPLYGGSACGDRRTDPWDFRDRVVHLPGAVRNGDGAGAGEYGSGSCCGSGHRGTSPTGKDRQGHSSRSSTDRSDHGSDRRTDHFCSQGTCFSGNMTGTENFCFRIGSGVGLWCDGPAAAGFRKGENIMELGEGLKKILLVGIGTAAVTAEKSKEILDELVKKGELTVEQGKVLNQELKHNIKSTVKTAADSVKESAARKNDQEELKATISRLTPEQLAAVKAQIERMQAEAAEEKAETAEEPAEEAVQEASAETENAEDTGSEEQAAE